MPGAIVPPLVVAFVFGMFAVAGVAGSCMGSASMLIDTPLPPNMPIAEPYQLLMERSRMLGAVNVVIALLLLLPLGLSLLGGGLFALLRRPQGEAMLRAGLMAGPVVELLFLAYGFAAQAFVFGPAMEMYEALAQMPGPGGGPMMERLSLFVAVITVLAIAFNLLWVAVKLAAYVWAGRQLRKDEVKDWFASLREEQASS